jgi:hypothetical protein
MVNENRQAGRTRRGRSAHLHWTHAYTHLHIRTYIYIGLKAGHFMRNRTTGTIYDIRFSKLIACDFLKS